MFRPTANWGPQQKTVVLDGDKEVGKVGVTEKASENVLESTAFDYI